MCTDIWDHVSVDEMKFRYQYVPVCVPQSQRDFHVCRCIECQRTLPGEISATHGNPIVYSCFLN